MKCRRFEMKNAIMHLCFIALFAFALTFNNNMLYAQEAVEYVAVEEADECVAVEEVAMPADEAAYEPPYVETNNTRTFFIIAIVVLLFVGIIYLFKKSTNSISSSTKTHLKCPKCGKVNPEGSLFCQNCGAKLGVI